MLAFWFASVCQGSSVIELVQIACMHVSKCLQHLSTLSTSVLSQQQHLPHNLKDDVKAF